MKNKLLLAMVIAHLFGCTSFANDRGTSAHQDTQASVPSLSLHSTPILLGSSLLVDKSHTSDGSDRAQNGKPLNM